MQLIRALFHLDIAFICWFRLNSPVLCSGVFIGAVDIATDKGLGHPHQSMYRHIWRVSLTYVCINDLWVKRMKDYLQILLKEPVCTLLYGDLPSAWGSMGSDSVFPCLVWVFFLIWRAPSIETPRRYVQKGSGNLASVSLCSAPWGEPGGTAPCCGLRETCKGWLWKRGISVYRDSVRRI